MTCRNCEANVKSSLLLVPNVQNVEASKEAESVTITMDKHISIATFQNALDKKFSISANEHSEMAEQAKSWLVTYKPVLLIFAYITAISLVAGSSEEGFNWMKAMNIFMAGFFLAFSFFKLLDLNGFAESYAMYDIVARKFPAWGFIYAFLELGLGIAYAIGFEPLVTNLVTFIVMTVSILGVIWSLRKGNRIRCACLGAVFNLPMTTITVIEDALMIAMSGGMIFAILYQ